MKIVITGVAGFIGSHLSEALLEQGHQIIGVDNFDPFYPKTYKKNNLKNLENNPKFALYELDITVPDALDIIDETPDVVIHLAAKAGVLPSIKDPEGYVRTNILGTQHVLTFIRKKAVKKYLFASSSSVYGNNKTIPFSEQDVVDFPISPYASTKKSCELINHTYHHLYGVDVLNLRFFTVFGPRQRPDLAIHKFFRLIESGEPITLYGDGNTARDYTFVADTVKGIVAALGYIMTNEGIYETLNLGNNKPVKLKDLVALIYEVAGKEPNLKYLPMQPGDVNCTFADISKARELLGYNPQMSLKTGLEHFYDWYKSNPHIGK